MTARAARADRGAARARARREDAREAARERETRRRDGADDRGRTTTDAHERTRCANGDGDARKRRTRRERRELERGAWNLEFGIWNLEFGIWNSKSTADANARERGGRRAKTDDDARCARG